MICPDCGRECQEEANYCFYCGHSFREIGFKAPTPEPVAPVVVETSEESAMGRLWWMLYFALLMFPATYPILFIITAVWAFGNKGSKERKNFAKAAITFMIILVVISLIVAFYYLSAYGLDGAIEKLTNGQAHNSEELMQMYGGTLDV